jgi:translocator protein
MKRNVRAERTASTKWTGLITWIAICFAAAAIGALMITPPLSDSYATLNKPAWTPPNGVFEPVWTLLYAGMGLAAWMVWLQRTLRNVTPALSIFAIQLMLNVASSGLFFALHSPGAALPTIVVLWCASGDNSELPPRRRWRLNK